ncbi:MAG: hypothetical protein WCT07_04505 [Candidatus Paceibacterota bacterium]
MMDSNDLLGALVKLNDTNIQLQLTVGRLIEQTNRDHTEIKEKDKKIQELQMNVVELTKKKKGYESKNDKLRDEIETIKKEKSKNEFECDSMRCVICCSHLDLWTMQSGYYLCSQCWKELPMCHVCNVRKCFVDLRGYQKTTCKACFQKRKQDELDELELGEIVINHKRSRVEEEQHDKN